MSILSRFLHNRRGNVAVLFALTLIPVTGAVGAAVDYTHYTAVKTRLSDALDASVLAMASQPAMTDKQAFDFIENWAKVHMGPDYDNAWKLDSVVQDGDGKVTATASGHVETMIARIIGIDDLAMTVTVEAMQTTGKVELVLVLDNTGSMKGTKLTKLKDAAKSMVDSLANAAKNPADLRIGLVPFSQTVNVGPSYKNANWIDAAGKSATAKSLFLGQQVNRFDLFTKLGKTWGGCVETRDGTYEATNALPDATRPDTLYVPYFAPDEPGAKGEHGSGKYNNSYLADSTLRNIETAVGQRSTRATEYLFYQGDTLKYTGGRPSTGTTDNLGYQYGPNSGCEIAALSRLSTNSAAIKTAIDGMIANGNTDIPVGLTWGWNVVAPDGPFGDGKPYDDKEWRKFVVLMTDGNNENQTGNVNDLSFYSGVGYVWQGRMGVPTNNNDKAARTAARDQRLGQMCTALKAKGVKIFTVRVEVTNGSSSVLKNCASDDDMFFDVQNAAQLAGVFQTIGEQIETLRLAE